MKSSGSMSFRAQNAVGCATCPEGVGCTRGIDQVLAHFHLSAWAKKEICPPYILFPHV